ncbi:MAG TPA: MFS transporter [Acidobacteriaceae bacterium]|jgi:sugar phosphate permease|nr:MFS transporter [Acidobacteriaceae bacterium]
METNRSERDLRRRWTLILPAVFVTYSLAYLDRANYGFGAAAGLAATLHISGYQSALLGALFFLGYFLPQVPAIMLLQRTSARWMIFAALVAWGGFAALTGVIRVYWMLVLDRFLLGVAESFVFPALLILLTRWFTKEERSRANSLLMLGNPLTVLWMSAVTGFLIQAWGWQRAFILEGAAAMVWGAVWLAVMRDWPHETRWMSEEARQLLEGALAQEQGHLPRMEKLALAFRQRNVVRLCANYFFWSVGVYGFVLWLPVVIRDATRVAIGKTGLLAAAPYLAGVILMLAVAHLSDRSGRRRGFVWPLLVLGGVALAGSYVSVAHSFAVAYGCLIVAGSCMYAPYGPFWAMVPELLPRNVAGETMALINCCGALGGFFGVYFVGLLQTYTGGPAAGFLLMSLSLILAGGLLLKMEPAVPADALRARQSSST